MVVTSLILLEPLEARLALAADPALQAVAQTGVTGNGVTVDYVEYPLDHDSGNPWSQWGKGLVHSNGKVYSAVGDHLGVNGNSWLYEFDPQTRTLRAVADLQSAVAGFRSTDYGFGKVHGRLNEGLDGNIYFASYWGTTRNDANYVGDHLFMYDPVAGTLTDLGVPAPGYGYPSTNMWTDGGIFYAEAFDKFSGAGAAPYTVKFMAYDLRTRQVKFLGSHEGSSYGRAFFVDADGNAYFNNGGRILNKYDPRTNQVTSVPNPMPGNNIRQVTRPDADGNLYATVQDGLSLFRFNPADGTFTALATVEKDTAALELDPTGRYLYYMPGAHNAAGTSNNPLVQYDLRTNTRRTVTTLLDHVATNYRNYLGGSYNLTVSDDGRRVYIGFNADRDAAERSGFNNPALVTVHLPDDGRTVFPSLTFDDVSRPSGLAAATGGQYLHASAWGDVNGDGRQDLFLGAFNNAAGEQGPNRLLLNNGAGAFAESPQPALNTAAARSAGAAFADFDNDGDLDLILVTNARTAVPLPNQLYRNEGGGRFANATAGSNLDLPNFSGRTPFVLDYDGDGLLDLFLQEDMFGGTRSSRLMRNVGGLVFQDATAAAGLPTDITGLGGAVGDLNGDGRPDLFNAGTRLRPASQGGNVPNNRLFLNNGNGTFRAFDAGVLNNPTQWRLRPGSDDWVAGAALGDLNNDGRLDLVIGAHKESALEHQDNGAWRNTVRVYFNDGSAPNGDPVYRDVTDATGIRGIYAKQPHVEIQDMDNDGRMDVVTSAVLGPPGDGARLEPVVYRNTAGADAGVRFELRAGLDADTWADWSAAGRPGPVNPRYFPGGGTADFDGDGRLDVFGQEALDLVNYGSALFRNTTVTGNRYLDVRIDTGGANRNGIGAEVRVYRAGRAGQADALLGTRSVSVSDGFSTGAPAVAHFGVGNAAAVDVVVQMPNGGATYTAANVPTNRLVTLPAGGAPRVRGRRVFYNNSAFDGRDARANADDDGAIATDKSALLPGRAGTFANYTSYWRGINGVMIDIVGLGGDPVAKDFVFRTGRTPGASSWAAAPVPAISVRRGAGTDGSDRVTLTWPDRMLRNTWLEVTVLPGVRTGLTSPDVFYFGNLIGDTGGPAAGAAWVDARDVLAVRRAWRAASLNVDNRFDFNRDGVLNALDQVVVRQNLLQSIPLGVGATAPPPVSASLLRAHQTGYLLG